MKKLIKFLLSLLLVFSFCCTQPTIGLQSKITSDNLFISTPINENKNSLVTLFSNDFPIKKLCNGYINKNGIVITAAHCTTAGKTILVAPIIIKENSIEISSEAVPYYVINYLYNEDVAYLYPTKFKKFFDYNFTFSDKTVVNPGEPVYFLDQYFNQRATFVSEIEKEITLETDQKPIAFSFPALVNPGDSGTPVFNSYNQLVGLITGRDVINNLTYAVYVQDLVFNYEIKNTSK